LRAEIANDVREIADFDVGLFSLCMPEKLAISVRNDWRFLRDLNVHRDMLRTEGNSKYWSVECPVTPLSYIIHLVFVDDGTCANG
jgi:hypothetical protein